MFTESSFRLTAAAALIAAVTAAHAQDTTIILDDFDADNSDELFDRQGLIAISAEEIPVLIADDDFDSGDDIGAVIYQTSFGSSELVAGQYPNDAGAEGASLGLDFIERRIIGFEADFRNVSATFPFGFTIEDDGPSGTVERKVGAVDTVIPIGDSTYRTLFTDPDWVIEGGFEFNEIRAVFYGLNNNPRIPGIQAPVDELSVELIEIRAIIDTSCAADFNGDGAANIVDVVAFINEWNTQGPGADFDANGTIDIFDVTGFIQVWTAGCP
jgi:hypothetical protein